MKKASRSLVIFQESSFHAEYKIKLWRRNNWMQKIFIGALLKVGYFRSLIIYGWHVYIGHSKISPTICSALHLHMVWSYKEVTKYTSKSYYFTR